VRKLLCLALIAFTLCAESELRICLRNDPKTFDPHLTDEESGETIRYLTAGVLIRSNRVTQQLEPELATSWKLGDGGRKITFTLRKGIRFSDGTPFTAQDVAFTVRRMMAPETHSPVGDSFRSGSGEVRAIIHGPEQVSIVFPALIAGLERLFDQVAIVSASSPAKEKAVLGPYVVSEHKAGSYVLLRRNRNFWQRDAQGRSLPYLDSIRLEIQANRDIEALRFRRRELDIVSGLDPVAFEQLKQEDPSRVLDAGPTQDNEMLWFNQVKRAPLPEYKKAWFASQSFRRAISMAINRADIVKLVYAGHAKPAAGPFSESNKLWYNTAVKAESYAPEAALRALQKDGFVRKGAKLFDRAGHPVELSLITNSGNKARARMASLVQQDLAQIGIRLNIVALDFPALLERITRSYSYEACLLGLMNVDRDPNGQMNIWLSSAANHPWNPMQKSPETAWEAEIDRLMRAQASSANQKTRKAHFDRVQAIVAEQAPIIYLVNKNALFAVDTRLRHLAPSSEPPNLLWNIQHLTFDQLQAKR
jgi:peptide/nickel transport system substrate-binding protein